MSQPRNAFRRLPSHTSHESSLGRGMLASSFSTQRQRAKYSPAVRDNRALSASRSAHPGQGVFKLSGVILSTQPERDRRADPRVRGLCSAAASSADTMRPLAPGAVRPFGHNPHAQADEVVDAGAIARDGGLSPECNP
jgi:hypothetical protein